MINVIHSVHFMSEMRINNEIYNYEEEIWLH